MKKFISIILATVVVLSTVVIGTVCVSAEKQQIVVSGNGYDATLATYIQGQDPTAPVVSHTKKATVMPVNDGGTGQRVIDGQAGWANVDMFGKWDANPEFVFKLDNYFMVNRADIVHVVENEHCLGISKIIVSTSVDGENYSVVAEKSDIPPLKAQFEKQLITIKFTDTVAKYVKVAFERSGYQTVVGEIGICGYETSYLMLLTKLGDVKAFVDATKEYEEYYSKTKIESLSQKYDEISKMDAKSLSEDEIIGYINDLEDALNNVKKDINGSNILSGQQLKDESLAWIKKYEPDTPSTLPDVKVTTEGLQMDNPGNAFDGDVDGVPTYSKWGYNSSFVIDMGGEQVVGRVDFVETCPSGTSLAQHQIKSITVEKSFDKENWETVAVLDDIPEITTVNSKDLATIRFPYTKARYIRVLPERESYQVCCRELIVYGFGTTENRYGKTPDGLEYMIINNQTTITGYSGHGGVFVIPEAIEGCPVTSIADDAFRNCASLTSVTIPDSVTSIGDSAFYNCKSLTSVTIPDSVTSIGDYGFYYCTSLTSVTIPNSVTSIGDYGFCGCSNLTSVTIPDSVTSIGREAFSGCHSLTSVTIPNSVTTIGSFAFSSCTSLTSVTIGNGVTSIGEWAFNYCTSLTSVTIGNSVTSIGDRAFLSCTSLTSVTIPDSVTSIGRDAFSSCTSLTSVTIGNGVTSIAYNTFIGCTSLTSINISEENKNYKSIDGNLYSKNETKLVLYARGKSDKSFTIPDSVISIGDYAFYECASLTSVTIPNSVTSIGGYAFYKCASLTSVEIPDSVSSIGRDVFSYCTSLTSATISNRVKSISREAFYYCASLTSVKIGNGVTDIGDDAFQGCSSLTSITMGNSVKWISYGAFYGCQKLTDVYYDGTEDDRRKIQMNNYDSNFKNATWHYADIELDKVQSVKTNNGDSATMRFFFEPEFYSEKADGYGTYIIPFDIFDEGDMSNTALVKKDQEIESGETYSVDLRKIPSTMFDRDIMAIPFLKFGDNYMTIVKPDIYIGNNVNATNIDKEEK